MYLVNAVPGAALIGLRGSFRPIPAEEARRVIRALPPEASAIGHEATAQALSAWAGVSVPCRRVTLTLRPGDRLLVAALRGPRLAEGQVLSLEEVEARGFDFLEVAIE